MNRKQLATLFLDKETASLFYDALVQFGECKLFPIGKFYVKTRQGKRVKNFQGVTIITKPRNAILFKSSKMSKEKVN